MAATLLLAFVLAQQASRPASDLDLQAEAVARVQELSSPDSTKRGTAVDRLLELGRPAGPALRTGLASASDEGRRLAVFCLGQLGVKESLADVKKLLRTDPSERVRIESAYSLGKMAIKGKGTSGTLASQLEFETSVKVLRACLVNLCEFDDPATVEPVLAFAESREDAYLRRIAVRTLAHLTGQSFEDDLPAWRSWWSTYGAKFLEMRKAAAEREATAPKSASTGAAGAVKGN